MRAWFVALLIILSAALPNLVFAAQEDVDHFKSASKQTTLLELFTSEGCSSCPPADAWLADFRDSDQLWTRIVPVAFHVTYWDQYGWTDPYGRRAFTDRQRAYVSNWHKSSPYTPNFVRNGMNWQLWFRHPRPSPIEPEAVEADAGPLVVARDGNTINVRYSPVGQLDRAPTLNVAVLAFGLTNVIRAGENNGRTLHHDFVVIGHNETPLAPRHGNYVARLNMPKTRRVEADRYALAAWVADPDDMHTLQATGGWLTHGLTR